MIFQNKLGLMDVTHVPSPNWLHRNYLVTMDIKFFRRIWIPPVHVVSSYSFKMFNAKDSPFLLVMYPTYQLSLSLWFHITAHSSFNSVTLLHKLDFGILALSNDSSKSWDDGKRTAFVFELEVAVSAKIKQKFCNISLWPMSFP